MSGIKHLEGKISVEFFSHLNIEELCIKHIPSYDPERFEVAAVRVFSGEEFTITVYAADKLNLSKSLPGKLKVKKFKIRSLLPMEFLNYVKAYNFTLENKVYDTENMLVINK
jgi:hypothetical protein